jgi:holo-[acyl-carrier protein] synthase
MSEIDALVESLSDPAGTTSVIRAGVDRVELDEFQRTVAAAGQPFLERVFTVGELAFATGRIERLADRFAAKEAVAKVLGTGFRGLGASEIEIVTGPDGQPHAELHGRAELRGRDIGLKSLAVSMTNTSRCAEAFAVGLCVEPSKSDHPGKEKHHA